MSTPSTPDSRTPATPPPGAAGLVYVVDDDEAVRDSMRWLLEANGFQVSSCASAEEFLARLPDPEPIACLLLDVRMPCMSGLELHEELVRRGSALPLIFITGHGDVPMAVAALKKGAFHFIEKPFNDHDLVDLVEKALATDDERLRAAASRETIEARLATLTQREREVMELILEGKYNKVIADELSISMRTVEAHRSRIFDKMEVRSAVELA